MTGKYRSALGKHVDMAALIAKNERVRAVGNMSVNARGDTIDSMGRIIVPVTKKVGEKYSKTVTNRAANLVKSRNERFAPIETAPTPESKVDLTLEELEFANESEDDLEVEKIKAKEVEQSKKK